MVRWWWVLFLTVLLGINFAGCCTTGFYGQNKQHRDMAIQAFWDRDWFQARKAFRVMAAQTEKKSAMTAGLYGLACVDMATAADIPSFLKALDTVSPEERDRFRGENPELFIFGADHGIRLMEKKIKDQSDQLLRIRLERRRFVKKIKAQERAIKHLKHQIQVLEHIDRELQEKRNPS